MMNNLIFILIIFFSLGAGLYVIMLTYQLFKKYRLSYLSTYLYFQIFFYVFGVYGTLGQLMAIKILEQRNSSFQTIETIGHFFSLFGLPFFILAWYMFIRLCREIIDQKLSRTFNLSYFFVLIFIFLVYGLVIVIFNLSSFSDKQYTLFSSITTFLTVALEALVLVAGLSQLFIYSKNIRDQKKQKSTQIFAWLNLFIYFIIIVFFLLAHQKRSLASVYLLLFFSGNIVPLLYWRTYLKRDFIPPTLQKTGPQAMKQFLSEHCITKREEEVIQQVCEGKSNKEISKVLFISLQTVKDHIYRIYQKTNVKNRVQLINLIQSYKNEEGRIDDE